MVRTDDSFGEFYTAEFRPLRRFAYLLTGNWSEAEELAQDAMERTYRAWSRITERDRPQAYARAVLVNRHRSILRRSMVEAKHRWRHEEREEMPEDMTEERVVLWRAVSSLPLKYRHAIVLRFYEDLPDAEIARIMECPIGTVKSLVHRGLARLRAATGGGQELAAVGSDQA